MKTNNTFKLIRKAQQRLRCQLKINYVYLEICISAFLSSAECIGYYQAWHEKSTQKTDLHFMSKCDHKMKNVLIEIS